MIFKFKRTISGGHKNFFFEEFQTLQEAEQYAIDCTTREHGKARTCQHNIQDVQSVVDLYPE